ncbi:MAG: protein kinase, partial [Acidobacteria bacterium]|nr:protein kinase [Acidobacteriota bacterium]
MPFCYECGVKVAPDEPFCGNCGTAQKPISANPPLPDPNRSSNSDQLAATDPTVPAPPADSRESAKAAPEQTFASEETVMSRHATDPQKPLSSVFAYESPEPADAPAPKEGRTGLSETLVGTVDGLLPSEAPEEDDISEVTVAHAKLSDLLNQTQPEAAPSEASSAADTDEHKPLNVDDTLEPAAETAAPSSAEPPVTEERNEPEEEEAVAAHFETGETAETDETPAPEAPAPEEQSAAPLNDTLPPEEVSRSTGELSSFAPAMETTVATGTTAGSSRRPGSKQLEAGTLLNVRYEIVRRIGGGGMGAVYLAKDRHLGDAPRAVKEMIETHLDESQHEKAIGDFKRESLLLTSLEHPSIPTIYDYFYDDQAGRFYLVMKYISGGDFASRLRNAPGNRIDEKTATVWGMEVADVLDYLHNRRPRPIIYRDLKPANLM